MREPGGLPLALTLGAALIMWPELGHGITAGSGETPRDFVSALLAAGNSLSIVGAGDFTPRTTPMRALYLFNSLSGASVLSLTLTYLMQVYTALLRRNSHALNLHLLSDESDAAAEKERCLGECATSYPDGKARYDIAIGCAEAKCATECM